MRIWNNWLGIITISNFIFSSILFNFVCNFIQNGWENEIAYSYYTQPFCVMYCMQTKLNCVINYLCEPTYAAGSLTGCR